MLRFLIVLVVVGVIAYLLTRALQERATLPGSSRRPVRRERRAEPPRMVAPDDDEDFLRDLDRRRLNPEDPDA